MNVLFVSAEVAPFVSVGGLSQVMYFLPKALRDLENDVRVFTAKYGTMDRSLLENKMELATEFAQLNVPVDESETNGKNLICNVLEYKDKETDATTYFLENREYYELRANVYGYKDDHIRFGLLSKGCLEWLYQIQMTGNWWPDIIHCHDWHTAYLIDYIKRTPRYAGVFKDVPVVLTIHNLSMQGNYDFKYGDKKDYDDGSIPLESILSSKFQAQNPLKRGLLFADAVNTVSPTHAVEVLTPQYSEGMDEVLHKVKVKVTGILNGLDTEKFDPLTDKNIKKKYDAKSFVNARIENKKQLQKLFDLPIDATRPLLSFSGRLVEQKGLDLILDVLPHLFNERPDVQMVFLGAGNERYRLELTVLQKQFPNQLGLHLRPDFSLPRKIFAGADMMLVPSIFEPGGIIALEALRYGCVPLVRRTGGLNDIVSDFNPNAKSGNGFSFKNIDSWALYGAIIESLTIYAVPALWNTLVKNCMKSDFSWNFAAKEYDSWYKRVVEDKNSKQ
ncbi:MAG TPA: glycogen/starch synthase [Gammaproteobacteria bacterium]|nr:glycogen/starch synthase [Gammaproteobacteria bacterium]